MIAVLGSMKNKADIHPIYIAVAEIEYNTPDKFAMLICKTFSDDLKSGLEKQYGNNVVIDESSPNLKKISADIEGYIQKHLQVKIDGEKVKLVYTNFKKQNNAVWSYFKLNNINGIEKIEVTDTILYEIYNNQVGLIYVTVNGNRKNRKITNPESNVSFDF